MSAFATSSPELAVEISSALAGRPQISLGDILGSDIVNVALILGSPSAFPAFRLPAAAMLLAFFMVWFAANILEAFRQKKDQCNPAAGERLCRKRFWLS